MGKSDTTQRSFVLEMELEPKTTNDLKEHISLDWLNPGGVVTVSK